MRIPDIDIVLTWWQSSAKGWTRARDKHGKEESKSVWRFPLEGDDGRELASGRSVNLGQIASRK